MQISKLIIICLATLPAAAQVQFGSGVQIGGGATTNITGSIVQSGIGYPSAPSIVSGFTAGTTDYYWCVAEDVNGRQTPSSTASTGTTGTTGTMSCGGQTGAVKYYLLRTTVNSNPEGAPQNTLIGSCTTSSGTSCNISDAANTPSAFQANSVDMTAVLDNGSFPPPMGTLGQRFMIGGLAHKQQTIGTGANFTIANITGQGALTDFWLAQTAYPALTLTCTRDGEGTPSINAIPTLNFFNMNFQNSASAQTRPFIGTYIGASPAAHLRVYIPFTTSINCFIHNAGTSVNVWTEVEGVYTKRNWGMYSHLHVVEHTASVAAYAESSDLLAATGPGVLWGTLWLMQGGDGNLQYLEGPVQLYFNGESTASYQTTGTEDYFKLNGYFMECTTALSIATRDFGCNIADSANSRVSAYRLFSDDAPFFNKSLKLTATAGVNGIGIPVTNNVSYTVDSFYYTAN